MSILFQEIIGVQFLLCYFVWLLPGEFDFALNGKSNPRPFSLIGNTATSLFGAWHWLWWVCCWWGKKSNNKLSCLVFALCLCLSFVWVFTQMDVESESGDAECVEKDPTGRYLRVILLFLFFNGAQFVSSSSYLVICE